jgi:hypothetical protein
MAKTVVNLSDQMAVFVQKANLISTHVGDLVTLTTANDSDLVGAINELDSAQGNIASLNTTNKSSLVAAVNEVKQQASNTDSDLSGFLRSNVNDVMTAGSIRFDDTIPLVIGTDSDFTLTHTGGTTTAAGDITFTGAMTVSNQFTSDSATINGDIDATGDFRSSTTGTQAAPNFAITSGALGVNGMFTPSANTLAFSSASTERMRISSTGNVGINEQSPDTLLHISSNAPAFRMEDTDVDRYANVSYGTRAFNIDNVMATGETATTVGAWTAFRFIDTSGTSEKMRLMANGRLSVGHNDEINISTLGVSNRNSTSNRMVAVHNAGGTSGFFNQIAFRNNGDTANIGEIVRVNDASVQYNTSSDKRLKDNIETLQNGTELLEEMRPVTFNWKTDGSSDTGFVAQEMLEVMPTAVNPGETEDDMMSMDYGRITPIIVAALQEANKKIEELQNRIEELEAK